MAVQDTYSENLRPAVPGQLVDMSPKTLISRTVEDANGIGFGLPAFQGDRDKGIKNAGTAAQFVGITVRERSLQAEANGFKQYDSARLITEGPVWVATPGAVVAGSAVTLGGVTIPGARYDTSTSAAGQVAQVRLGVVSAPTP
ncbi:hypothetical protein K1T36_20835 [Pseudomonas protegens]|uniref:structural cement protein Gp24 n=1 Tax=Pseudomonas protegens TaxID=380021 RepID=UPI001C697366|nr:hypothetical protein [Pseudomonas protegens]QYM99515.1 hypothetical protein K1T36_20835 [Pseudomonas protegens]